MLFDIFKNNLANRGKDYPSPSQLRKIEVLWKNVSRAKNDKSLRAFIKRLTKKSDITFILRDDASKVINALNKMGA